MFTKTNAGGTDKVWFYDMKADGYTLDQKRTECTENDIPDVIARFKNMDAEATRTRKEQSFLVPVEEIRDNDYDLSINKYKEVERVKVEYEAPEVIFGKIASCNKTSTTPWQSSRRSTCSNDHDILSPPQSWPRLLRPGNLSHHPGGERTVAAAWTLGR